MIARLIDSSISFITACQMSWLDFSHLWHAISKITSEMFHPSTQAKNHSCLHLPHKSARKGKHQAFCYILLFRNIKWCELECHKLILMVQRKRQASFWFDGKDSYSSGLNISKKRAHEWMRTHIIQKEKCTHPGIKIDSNNKICHHLI
jgi:hypothetical protein